MSIVRIRIAVAGLGALALAACSGGPTRVSKTPPPPVAIAASETDAVFVLLMSGKEEQAKKNLKSILKRDPMNATARLLSDSIARDPKELLGPQSYAYSARAGDTIVTVAQRFLGNRLKAYQLLRYNNLKAPVTLAPGQLLRIPGEPPRIEPVKHTDPAPSRPAPAPVTPKPKTVAPKVIAPAPTANNPVAARQLRTGGLAALNQGNVNRAVMLLQRASQLDPANPVITRDLARAERIAATVRARK